MSRRARLKRRRRRARTDAVSPRPAGERSCCLKMRKGAPLRVAAQRATQLNMPSEDDLCVRRRALRLAMNGRGAVEPNPMVGCVIVSRDGRTIGEGYHARFGSSHAEPAALGACIESPEGATVYVTMEPCCHTNKKTPPCAP